MSYDEERTDNRKVCQVCGRDDSKEYQVTHKTERGFYTEDEKLELCPECGQKFVDGVADAAPDIIGRDNG